MASYIGLAKAIKTAILEYFPRKHLVALGIAVPALAISVMMPSDSNEVTSSEIALATPAVTPTNTQQLLPSLSSATATLAVSAPAGALTTAVQTDQLVANPAANAVTPAVSKSAPAAPKPINSREFVVQSGDSLSLIFRRAGLSDKDIYELFNSASDAKQLRSIRPGQKLAFTLDNKKLKHLTYIANDLEQYSYTRAAKGFTSKKLVIEPDIKHDYGHGTIDSSLYLAAKRAGMNSNITMELANIFAWDIDFAQDIKKGDSFKVMYERHYVNGKVVGTGKVLAAEFVNNGKTFRAVRYVNAKGEASYYTPDGRGMQKAFLRSPIEFARISSHFNLARKHPVLAVTRAHKGTDYVAPVGTPIMATGGGKLEFVGRKNGFGNTVIISHSGGFKTLYAHLKGFPKGLRRGQSVSQGDTIGYLGATGLVSGPHLHYEFHVNGQVKNPVTVPLPKSLSIDKAQLAHFNATTRPLIAKLNQLSDATQVAMLKNDTNNN